MASPTSSSASSASLGRSRRCSAEQPHRKLRFKGSTERLRFPRGPAASSACRFRPSIALHQSTIQSGTSRISPQKALEHRCLQTVSLQRDAWLPLLSAAPSRSHERPKACFVRYIYRLLSMRSKEAHQDSSTRLP